MTQVTGYYATSEVAELFGWKRQAVSVTARREGWGVVKIGNSHLYASEDVRAYRDARHRTQLAREFGWTGRGLYRDEDIDIECPVCGAFAIEWPPLVGDTWLCLEGHKK